MRFFLLFLFSLVAFSVSDCQRPAQTDAAPGLVPRPASVSPRAGHFTLRPDTRIWLPESAGDWALAADYFAAAAANATGYRFEQTTYGANTLPARQNAIVLQADPSIRNPEGYQLDVSAQAVVIKAGSPAGAFYAVQTLLQLFPPEIYAAAPQKANWKAACCAIADYPRFAYRGLMLDAGRHFFSVDFIKRFIDLLAAHKLNRFHWHLTEDQGWRMEIKKYPKLQSVAACRKETLIGHYTDQPRRFDGKKYCGYYTREQVKEVLEYARRRFVTVVPEIEMPGHAMAALSAYPELGCTGGPYEAPVVWGVQEDVFCAGNEQTFVFLENVLEEVCALFPGEYIHIGGDECPKTRWEKCPKCQARKKAEGLKDEHELQSYFIRRIEKILARKGKKLIGWDEILEGGLAPSATVMSWRGTEGGIAAAKQGHDAIMTPTSYCYFDYYQSEPSSEPLAIGGYLPLEKTYSYEPVAAELTPEEAKHILGTQGNVWTEYIATPEKAEYMSYPRACALAEIAWSKKELKNWPDFARRLQTHFARLDALGVQYARSYYDISASFAAGKVSLQANSPDVEIRYTTDGSEPGASAKRYAGPFALARTTTVKGAAFKGGKRIGNVLTQTYKIHKASGKKYSLSGTPKQYKGGNAQALTDGVLGHAKTHSAWVGLVNKNIDPVIDFGAPVALDSVITHYLDDKGSWIHPPLYVEIAVSNDGKNFRSVGRQDIPPSTLLSAEVKTVAFATPGVKARYLKLTAASTGVIPAGYPGAGQGAWLFVDEVEAR